MLMPQPLRLLGGIRQDALALIAQWEIDRSRNFLANGGMTFNLLPNRFDRRMLPEEPVGKSLIFAQQAQQQVFRLYIRRAELAGLVSREEDHASGLFRVPFKHLYLRASRSCR